MSGSKGNLRAKYKSLRQKVLAAMPFIKRRKHNKIVARLEAHLKYEREAAEGLGFMFLNPPTLATQALCEVRSPIKSGPIDELCLFVSHAPSAELKAHVVDHILALLDDGIAVLLVVNADVETSRMRIPVELAARLYGCIIRQNVGFDFAAWAHAYAFIEPESVRRRLLLINDSIVGPLDRLAYGKLLRRIRDSQADIVGLTSNPDPHDHLQSYFLVFNERVLRSTVFVEFMRGVLNMPLKQNVIDCYEIWLTPFLQRKGFKAESVFPLLSEEPPPRRNDTVISWQKLIAIGFPFVKSMVLRDSTMAADVERLIPARYR